MTRRAASPALAAAVFVGVLAGLIVSLSVPRTASAEPVDEPVSSVPTTTIEPVGEVEPNLEPTQPVPVPTLPPIDTNEDPLVVGESLIPDPGVDEFPTRNYDIGYDEGAWNSFSRKGLGFLTAAGWMVNQVTVAVVLWFTGWAFGFDIIGPLKGPILTISATWQRELIGPIGLNDIVWFIVMTYVALQVWRGRAMNALGELAVSVIALAVALTIGANPGGYLDGAQTTLNQVSGATLAISRGEAPTGDPSQASAIVDPLRGELHDVLIEEPYEIINWGHPLSGACAQVARDMVAEGPWGTKNNPRNAMSDAGCTAESDFNHDPTFDRMASAWMAAAVSAVVLVLLLFAVVTMLMGSLFFVLRFSWLPLALLGFQLPGGARELSWGWLVGLAKNLGVVAAMSFVISYMLMLTSAFLTATDLGLSQRFTIILIVAVAMFGYRKQVLEGINHFTQRLRGELGAWRPGLNGRGAGGWTGSAAGSVAGMTGFGVGQRARQTMLDVPGSHAYEAAYAGRRFHHQSSRRSGGGRSGRGFQQRVIAGSATDLGD